MSRDHVHEGQERTDAMAGRATPWAAEGKLPAVQRQLERAVDEQVRTIRALDDKAANLLRLVVVLTGAGLAVVGLVRPDGGFSLLSVLSVALAGGGLLANGVATVLLLHAYVGLPGQRGPEAAYAPDLGWLVAAASDPDWTRFKLRAALVRVHQSIVTDNEEEISRLTALRHRAVLAAVSATSAYVVAILMGWGVQP